MSQRPIQCTAMRQEEQEIKTFTKICSCLKTFKELAEAAQVNLFYVR